MAARLSDRFARTLPPGLEDLADLALDLRWTWSHAADELWRSLAPQLWQRVRNPWLILQTISEKRLQAAAADAKFVEEVARLADDRRRYLSAQTWCQQQYGNGEPQVAYFCMEFGLADSLPLYSGGLGILAGDSLKTASDLGVCVTGVGLLYQVGYFRQMLDMAGNQLDLYPVSMPGSLPITAVRDADGGWLTVRLSLPGRHLNLRVWQAQVGRVSLYLLDSNDPLNSPADRGITARLYDEHAETRLMQQIVLGIGGWRALQALGISPAICHINEGHAAFAALERIRQFMRDRRLGFEEALWATRAGNVFTTHTAVPAAFDVYPQELLRKYGVEYATELGMSWQDLLALGRADPADEQEPFNMAYLAVRTCGSVNGVSELHGAVSRATFQPLFARWPQREVPVGHVTNGVHVPSWDSRSADAIWTRACGKGRWLGDCDALAPAIAEISDETLWALAAEERIDLIHYVRDRLAQQLARRGLSEAAVNEASHVLDPNALTLGFARRFTAYKRPNLLLDDPQRLARLLSNAARPVQIIVAGKAHPKDAQGKRYVREWAEFASRPDIRHHVVFLEDYDIPLAQELVQGVDVWINSPRRLLEACGTSGMKVLVNGGLNVSVRDGWWAEAYTSDAGWTFAESEAATSQATDRLHAGELYEVLEREVVPLFYERDAAGVPRAWIARIRVSLSRLAPRFSSNRMLRDYMERCYRPAAALCAQRASAAERDANAFAARARRLNANWALIRFGALERSRAGGECRFEVQVYLGEITPDEVTVELYREPAPGDETPSPVRMEREAAIAGSANGYRYRATIESTRPLIDFTPRVVAARELARIPLEFNRILWWRAP